MPTLSSLTAVILAGGLGTRLRAAVADRPKVLAGVNGRPFLAYLLDQLAGAGVGQIVICIGYLGEQVQAAFGNAYQAIPLIYSHEAAPLGTAGALRLALPLLQSETALILNGDSYCETDLNAFWGCHSAHGGEATLCLTHVPDTARYGRVQVAPGGRVLSFEEKGAAAGEGWINAGLYLLRRSVLSAIPDSRAVSIEREIFPAQIGRGLYAYLSAGQFLDIGTPESYAAAEPFFARSPSNP